MPTVGHHKRRAFSDKQNALNMFNSHNKVKAKSCSTGIYAGGHSAVCSNNNMEEQCSAPKKTKRLKTIKQRNQIREQNSNRSKHSWSHCERGRKDKGPCRESQDCQCIHRASRKEKPFAKPFLSRKPSIITEGRLTSIRGLFSHEVRSVDIERLVTENNQKKHTEKEEGQATSPSSLIPVLTPPVVISETSEEHISARANKKQTSEKTDCVQINLEGTFPGITQSGDGKTPQATDNTARSGSPSYGKGIEDAVILSSSESEIVHRSFPSPVKVCHGDHNFTPKKKHTHDQKQSNKTTAAVDVQHDFVNTERQTVGSEVLNSDAPHLNPSPAVFMFSSPTSGRVGSALGDPFSSSKEEAVSNLAARLCHSLVSFPIQRCYPLLTECRNVLLQNLQERHGSPVQHSLRRLHSYLSAEGPHSSHTAEQVRPSVSSVKNFVDHPNIQMCFNYERKQEQYDQQNETMGFQTGNDSGKQCLQEGFFENVERSAATKWQRNHPWRMYSSQDFVTKLQSPNQDMFSQWSITAQSEESLTTKQQSNTQIFTMHQAFSGPQTPKPWSSNRTDQILGPVHLEPRKQVILGSGENRMRYSLAMPQLEQWRNDPDLNFLFQEENSKRTHRSLFPLTDLMACSSHHDIENVIDRPNFGATSTVSSFVPPEGFCYEPYYQFPHPSNSFNRSEKSGMTLYTQLDVEKRSLCPSLHFTSPHF